MFVEDATDNALGRDLPAAASPASGNGFWYLLRADCVAGSWTSEGAGELAGRDPALP